MAYKPGVALAASISLIIFSGILLAGYIVCDSVFHCVAIPSSYASPLWTAVAALLTGIMGVFMSTTKSEKGCGPWFLTVSIICIFTSLACMGLTLYTSLYSIDLYVNILSANAVWEFSLWIAMMSVAFILSIITCVTSCQYCCCCQETHPIQETVIVYQGREQLPQNITLTNTNTIHPQQQVHPQILVVHPNGTPLGGQFVQQGYPVQQVLTQPVGGAPGQPWYPPPPNAARSCGVLGQYMISPGQPQPSAPPPPYQPQTPVTNQIRPVTTGQNQSQSVQPSTTPCAQPQSFYQPLIAQSNQTSASQIQHTYSTSEQAQQGVNDPLHQPSGTPTSSTYAYAQTIERSPGGPDDGSYLEASNLPNNPASGIDSEAYEYIKEPSYDYADTQGAREIVSPEEHSQYINDSIAKRPKAKRPK